MSTKTTFKRIALIVTATLGLGFITAVPTQAVINAAPTLTVAGTSTATKAKADSSTAATITVGFLPTAAADTLSIQVLPVSRPKSSTAANGGLLFFGDTVGSLTTVTGGFTNHNSATESLPAGTARTIVSGAGAQSTIKYLFQLDSSIARDAGSYVYSVQVSAYPNGILDSTKTVTSSLTITIAALSSESATPSAASSVAYLVADNSTVPTSDMTSSVLATASTTAAAYLYVNLVNSGGGQASESVTITTTIGNFGPSNGVATGKSLTVEYASGGAKYYPIFPDGTAGTAVITVKSSTLTWANKSLVFYAANPATLVARALNTQPGVGTNNSAVEVVAKDANGVLWGGTLRIYSDTLATISDTGTACTNANTTVGAFLCPVNGLAVGTAKVKAYASAQTVVSNEVSLTVVNASAASVALSWDKASYAPGEKATLTLQVLDSAGKPVANNTFTSLLASGGISLSQAAGNGSDTLTAVTVTTSTPAQNYVGTSTTGAVTYTVYMPPTGGTITASATGGAALPAAGQVKVTASATIADSGSSALAAVTALASQVSAFITKINAQITTLTDLVMKIQKKVKA